MELMLWTIEPSWVYIMLCYYNQTVCIIYPPATLSWPSCMYVHITAYRERAAYTLLDIAKQFNPNIVLVLASYSFFVYRVKGYIIIIWTCMLIH